MRRRWWNCWLAHSWAPWSDPVLGVVSIPWGPERPTWVQERRCEACNERQLRRAA